jgi:hypothetical protein
MNRIPKNEREKYHVDYVADTPFSSYARLLQSKWREKKGYNRPDSKLGNYLELDFAKTTKSNYLTDTIKEVVSKEVADSRSNGKLISEPRIWNNLLSSQPLCFNLFGELSNNIDLATDFFKHLFPNRIDKVEAVDFEFSPGRRDKQFTGDRSAFDVFVKYVNGQSSGFIGIEVKYAESLREETQEKADKTFNSHKEEYQRLTTSDYFLPNSIDGLRMIPVSQIWRDHMLSIALKQKKDEGFFVFLYPSKNDQCQMGVDLYKKYLICDDENVHGFCPRYLEDFIDALMVVCPADWTKELKERYFGE